MRRTKQRDAIREVFEQTTRPLGPDEVHEMAQKAVPGIGIATVYRNLRALEDEGLIQPVLLPGNVQLYERTGQKHHHFFRCRRCDRHFDIQACPGDLSHLVPAGFTVEEHEIMLMGVCKECAY